MKFFEAQNEDAIEILGNLLEPASKILTNEEVQKLYKAGGSKLEIVKAMLHGDKKAVIEFAAIMNGENPETYKCTATSLIKDLLAIMNNPELKDLFQLQGRSEEKTSSGSAMENTEASEQ